MELNQKIKLLERYSKALGSVSFTVSIKGNQATVKLGKKYNVCRCPDKDSAVILSEVLTTAARTQQGKVDQVLSLLTVRCEQLELQLFSKDVKNETQGNGDQSEGRVSDSVESDRGGSLESA